VNSKKRRKNLRRKKKCRTTLKKNQLLESWLTKGRNRTEAQKEKEAPRGQDRLYAKARPERLARKKEKKSSQKACRPKQKNSLQGEAPTAVAWEKALGIR